MTGKKGSDVQTDIMGNMLNPLFVPMTPEQRRRYGFMLEPEEVERHGRK